MTRWIRLELRILRAYAVVSAGALLVVALAAFGQPAGPQNFGEITVQRKRRFPWPMRTGVCA